MELFVVTRPTWAEFAQASSGHGPHHQAIEYLIPYLSQFLSRDLSVLRFLPLIWGIASVAILYVCGSLLINRRFGFLWAFLLAISVFHIDFSVTFRPYSFLVFLSCLSLLAYLKIGKRAGRIAYLLSSVLSVGTYSFAILKLGVDLWFSKRDRKKRLFILVTLGCSLLIPLLWTFLLRPSVVSGAFAFPSTMVTGVSVYKDLLWKFSQGSTLLCAVYAGLFLWGIGRSLFSPFRERTVYGLFIGGGTLILIIAATRMFGYYFTPRHALPLLPFYLGFVAAGLCWMGDYLSRWMGLKGQLVGFVLSLLFFGFTSADYYHRFLDFQKRHSQDISASVSYLASHRQPGETVIFSNPNFGTTFLYLTDPEVFVRLGQLQTLGSLGRFVWRSDLSLNDGGRIRTLSNDWPSVATASADDLRPSSQTWLIYSPMNHVYEGNPFEPICRDRKGRFQQEAPLVYRCDELIR
jgi:hypothetical protein